MSKLILNSYDFNKNEIQNVKIQNLASAPGSPVEGQIYFDTTLHQLGCYQNTTWVYLSAASSNPVTKASAASAGSVLQVSGGADRTLADFISAGGIIKVSSTGVVSLAVAGTDYLTASSTNTLTNKTFDAAGVGNTLSNIATSMFATNVIDTDTTLNANSDTRIASQKAVKAYIDGKTTSALVYIGGIDASTNPNYPAANKGAFYKVTVAGLIGGGSGIAVQVGDSLICNTTAISGTQAAVGASWDIVQANVDQATASTLGLVTLATLAETEAKSVTTKAVVPADLANFPIKKTATIGDGVATAIAVTDNLGTIDKIGRVRRASDNVEVECDVTYASNTTTFTFATAPGSNAYKVVIMG